MNRTTKVIIAVGVLLGVLQSHDIQFSITRRRETPKYNRNSSDRKYYRDYANGYGYSKGSLLDEVEEN